MFTGSDEDIGFHSYEWLVTWLIINLIVWYNELSGAFCPENWITNLYMI